MLKVRMRRGGNEGWCGGAIMTIGAEDQYGDGDGGRRTAPDGVLVGVKDGDVTCGQSILGANAQARVGS